MLGWRLRLVNWRVRETLPAVELRVMMLTTPLYSCNVNPNFIILHKSLVESTLWILYVNGIFWRNWRMDWSHIYCGAETTSWSSGANMVVPLVIWEPQKSWKEDEKSVLYNLGEWVSFCLICLDLGEQESPGWRLGLTLRAVSAPESQFLSIVLYFSGHPGKKCQSHQDHTNGECVLLCKASLSRPQPFPSSMTVDYQVIVP